jgi:hypothetical protein
VLAYHLGDLKSDEEDPREAEARALKYPSRADWFHVVLRAMRKDIKDLSEIHERYNDAYRRLFAKVGLEFDDTPRKVLFDALVMMINQLPDQWLKWLRSNLQQWCPDAEIAADSNLPRRLSGDNAFIHMSQSAMRIRLGER